MQQQQERSPLLLLVGAIVVLLGSLALAFGVSSTLTNSGCSGGGTGTINSKQVPRQLVPIYIAAASQYQLGPKGPAVLAAINKVETDFGRNLSVSSAGAIGWMQFEPGTWGTYGVDANHDGHADPYNPVDAIFSAANYLHASHAPADWRDAILAYNHAGWYADEVLLLANQFGAGRGTVVASAQQVSLCGATTIGSAPQGTTRIVGGGRITAIPGQPGESDDSRIIPNIVWLAGHYHLRITAGYATSGHAGGGEHPIGLAIDAVPGPGGSWNDIDRMAADLGWKRSCGATGCIGQGLDPAFRFIGYDGYPGHGRGNHIHLSWMHGGRRGPPADWVIVMDTTK